MFINRQWPTVRQVVALKKTSRRTQEKTQRPPPHAGTIRSPDFRLIRGLAIPPPTRLPSVAKQARSCLSTMHAAKRLGSMFRMMEPTLVCSSQDLAYGAVFVPRNKPFLSATVMSLFKYDGANHWEKRVP